MADENKLSYKFKTQYQSLLMAWWRQEPGISCHSRGQTHYVHVASKIVRSPPDENDRKTTANIGIRWQMCIGVLLPLSILYVCRTVPTNMQYYKRYWICYWGKHSMHVFKSNYIYIYTFTYINNVFAITVIIVMTGYICDWRQQRYPWTF